jgi:cytochrome P450
MAKKVFSFNSLHFAGLFSILIMIIGCIRLLHNSFDILGLFLIIMSLYIIGYMFILYLPCIKGIPVVYPDSIFGFTTALIPQDNGTNHMKMINIARKYGKLAQFRMFGESVVVINDGYMAKNALKEIHGKGKLHRLIRGNDKLSHPSTVNLDTNDQWSLRHNLFRGAFSASQLKSQSDIITSLCLKLSSKLELYADSNKPINIDHFFGQLTIDVICNVAFQMDINALGDSDEFALIRDSLRTQFEASIVTRLPYAEYLIYLPIKGLTKFRKAREITDNFAKKILDHLYQLQNNGTLKSNSLGQAILTFASTSGITLQDVLMEINLMFVAGHETTAHTLSWFVYSLATHQSIQDTIQNNTDTISDHLSGYLEAVLKESMRKYPVVSFGSFRQVKDVNGYKLMDGDKAYHIPYNTWILVNIYTLHNWEGNWGSDASNFIPERWLANQEISQIDSKDITDSIMHTTNPLSSQAIYSGGGMNKDQLIFAPFSHGPRHCLGMNLALIEIKAMINELTKKFIFTLTNAKMYDETQVLESYITLRPRDELPVYVKYRHKKG